MDSRDIAYSFIKTVYEVIKEEEATMDFELHISYFNIWITTIFLNVAMNALRSKRILSSRPLEQWIKKKMLIISRFTGQFLWSEKLMSAKSAIYPAASCKSCHVVVTVAVKSALNFVREISSAITVHETSRNGAIAGTCRDSHLTASR